MEIMSNFESSTNVTLFFGFLFTYFCVLCFLIEASPKLVCPVSYIFPRGCFEIVLAIILFIFTGTVFFMRIGLSGAFNSKELSIVSIICLVLCVNFISSKFLTLLSIVKYRGFCFTSEFVYSIFSLIALAWGFIIIIKTFAGHSI